MPSSRSASLARSGGPVRELASSTSASAAAQASARRPLGFVRIEPGYIERMGLAAAHRLPAGAGAPRYRLEQATRAATIDLAERWAEVTTLPRALREQLDAEAPLRELEVEETQRGADGTV